MLYIDVHGELCVFDREGVPVQGLTSGSSSMNPMCGSPKKREYVIAEKAEGGETVDLWADAGCNDLFGARGDLGLVEYADISICRENVKALYYDAYILFDLMKELPEDTARYHRLLQSLFEASCQLWDLTDEEVENARNILAKELAKQGGDSDLRLSAVGHAHIDLAWLWRQSGRAPEPLRPCCGIWRNIRTMCSVPASPSCTSG